MEGQDKPLVEQHDPLLSCLAYILKSKGLTTSPEALRAQLPLVKMHFSPSMFIKAAENMGFKAQLQRINLRDIHELALPAVLLLKGGGACVLVKKDTAAGKATLVLPEAGDGVEVLTFKELAEQYSGMALFVKNQYEYESRSDEKKLFEVGDSWLWGTLWHFRNLFGRVVLASVFINLFVVAMPLFIMNVYDRVVPNKAIETLWVLASGIFIVLIFDYILKLLRSYFIDAAGKKADIIISSSLLSKSLNIAMEAQPASSGVRANHLKEFETVREFFSSATVATFVDLPFIILFIAVIGFIGGPLLFLPLITALIVIVMSAFVSYPLFNAVKESYVGSAQKTAIIYESLAGVESIKSTQSAGSFLGRWQRYTTLASKTTLKARTLSNFVINTTMLLNFLTTVGVVIWGVYLIKDGEMTLGALIACIILTSRALAPLTQISQLLLRAQLTRCALKALDDIMAAPVDRPVGKKYLTLPLIKGHLELDEVTFRYPNQQIELFKDLSLAIKAGEKVAILGNIGSGKSTLFKIFDGLYRPIEGSVKLDGIDMRQLDPADVHRNIGYLEQNPRLFFGTARQNITLKAPWVDDVEVLRCAKLSGADLFLSSHPEGYNMLVGENGRGLSSGQAQAIALARTLLLDPPILLLDEPTSFMDSQSEQRFIQQMKTLAANKTLVLTTHKHGLLELVDRIVVIQQGRITMDGPKEKVLAEINKVVQSMQK